MVQEHMLVLLSRPTASTHELAVGLGGAQWVTRRPTASSALAGTCMPAERLHTVVTWLKDCYADGALRTGVDGWWKLA